MRSCFSDQSQKFVWVIGADNKAEYRKVKPGPMIDSLRVIREGLQSNDRVVVLGLQSVRPGIEVKPEEADPQKFVGGSGEKVVTTQGAK